MSAVIHSERVKGIGMLRVYNARRCDTCGAEQRMSEHSLDGNVLPSGWTRTYKKIPNFSLQQDHCGNCSQEAANAGNSN